MRLSPRTIIAALFATFVLGLVHGIPFNNSADEQPVQRLLASAPPLLLRVTLGGNNIPIHGQTAFSIFAKPVLSQDNTTVRYDGFTTIVQDDDTEFTYMLVDGAGYVVTTFEDKEEVRCLPSVSPFDLILPALNRAIETPSIALQGETINCPGGSIIQTSFGGLDFSFCAVGESGATGLGTFTQSGAIRSDEQTIDVAVSIEYLSNPIKSFSAPALSGKHTACPVRMEPTSVTLTTLTLLTGGVIQSTATRQLKASVSEATEGSCGCKSTPRPCIFLHGMGNSNEEAELQDTPELTDRKFGYIGGHAPCCSTIKYAVLNTVDYGWTNDTLQQKFCDHSLSMSSTSDWGTRTIKDTIVVTHSMGGIVMAGALANGRCSFDTSASWVSLSPPMRGSMASDFSEDLCNDGLTSFGTDVLELVGKCPSSIARKSVPYQNGKYSTPELNAAYEAAQEAYRSNVYAAMCSDGYRGVLSAYFAPCIIGGVAIPHKSARNDGLVEFESCLGGLDASLFGDSYHDRFYRPMLNHADTAFLTRDGFFRDSQKPFKWFECLL